jgi:hypothetical protein
VVGLAGAGVVGVGVLPVGVEGCSDGEEGATSTVATEGTSTATFGSGTSTFGSDGSSTAGSDGSSTFTAGISTFKPGEIPIESSGADWAAADEAQRRQSESVLASPPRRTPLDLFGPITEFSLLRIALCAT